MRIAGEGMPLEKGINLKIEVLKKLKKVLTIHGISVYNSKAVSDTADTERILAQLGEHLPYKQRVIGSSPIGPILLPKDKRTKHGEIAQLARAYGSYP